MSRLVFEDNGVIKDILLIAVAPETIDFGGLELSLIEIENELMSMEVSHLPVYHDPFVG